MSCKIALNESPTHAKKLGAIFSLEFNFRVTKQITHTRHIKLVDVFIHLILAQQTKQFNIEWTRVTRDDREISRKNNIKLNIFDSFCKQNFQKNQNEQKCHTQKCSRRRMRLISRFHFLLRKLDNQRKQTRYK